MRDYSSTEIGMLIGIAIGGAISAIGILTTSNPLFLAAAAICTAAGVAIGNMADKKRCLEKVKKREKERDI